MKRLSVPSHEVSQSLGDHKEDTRRRKICVAEHLRRQMAGMRDRLVHDYMGVNYYIVWDVAKNILPQLTTQIEEVIAAEHS